MAGLTVGTRVAAVFTHVEFSGNECCAYGQLCDSATVDDLAEKVEISAAESPPASSFNKGDIVLALYNEDRVWYRARIESHDGGVASVFFIDYGNKEKINNSDIKVATSELRTIEGLATKCDLVDILPNDNTWTEAETEQLESLLVGFEFTVEVVGSRKSGSLNGIGLRLYSDTGLFKHGKEPTAKIKGIKSSSARELQIGMQYKAYLSYVDSANKFWIQLADHENELNNLMTSLADSAAGGAEKLDCVSAGTLCMTFYSEDQAPYRSSILTVNGNTSLVQFVDYGNSESKDVSELLKLPKQFHGLPAMSVKCCYKRTKVDNNTLEEKLQELTESDGVLVRVLGRTDDVYNVEIDKIEKIPLTTPQNNSHHFIPLELDSTQVYDVCLSHVEHPGKFFIQLLENGPELDQVMVRLTREFNSSTTAPSLSAGTACIGQLSDDQHYRCVIQSVSGDNMTVHTVDFGFDENIKASRLRAMSSVFLDVPCYTTECTVDVTKTLDKFWSSTEIKTLKDFESKVSLVAKVTTRRNNLYQLDLYDTRDRDEDRYINAEMFGVGKSAQKAHTIKMETMRSEPSAPMHSTIPIPPPEITTGGQELLCITAVKSPSIVYGQLTKTNAKKIESLQIRLNEKYDNMTAGEMILSDSSVGTSCATRYSDGGWYRALVTQKQGNNISIAFADFGDETVTQPLELKQMLPEFGILPQQCVLCQLPRVSPSNSKEMTEKLLLNKVIEVKLLSKKDGVYPTYDVEFTSSIRNQGLAGKLEGSSFGLKQPPRLPKAATVNKDARVKTINRGDGYNILQVDSGCSEEVMVTHVVDPQHFHVQVTSMAKQLDAVMDNLQAHYDSLTDTEETLLNPYLGQPCIAKYTDDNSWYRAKVSGLLNNGRAEVTFVDYGNTECLQRETLKRANPEFMELPTQAIFCGMSGVKATQGFWSPEHIAQFEDIALDQNFTAIFQDYAGETDDLYTVRLHNQAGEDVNHKYGTSTNSIYAEHSDRKVAMGKGIDMRIEVQQDNEWIDHAGSESKPSTGNRFGGRSGDRGGNRGFGGSDRSGGNGFGNRYKDNNKSGGYGGQNRDEDRGGGFGGRSNDRGSGFGGQNRDQERSGGGFGGRSNDRGGGFGGQNRDQERSGGGFVGRSNDRGGGFGGQNRDQERSGGGFGGRSNDRGGGFGGQNRDQERSGGGFGGRSNDRGGGFGGQNRDQERGGGGFGGRSNDRGGGFGGQNRDQERGGFGGRPNDRRGGGGFMGQNRDRGGGDGSGFGGRSNDRGGGFRGQNRDQERGGFGGRPNDRRGGGGFVGQNQDRGEGFGGKRDGGSGDGFSSGGFSQPQHAAPADGDWDTDITTVVPDKPATTSAIPKSRFRGTSQSTPPLASSDQKSDAWARRVGSVTFTSQKLVADTTCQVFVVYSNSPGEFWCQLVDKATDLQTMMDQMNEHYNSLSPTKATIDQPEIGMPCVAKFSEDKLWYRAEILSFEDKNIEVQFIDYGNSELVDLRSVKHIQKEFTSLPLQAIRCCLSGVKCSGSAWSEKAMEDFETLTTDKELICAVKSQVGGSYLVHLGDASGELDVALKLHEAGYCALTQDGSGKPQKVVVKVPYPAIPISIGSKKEVYVSWIEDPSMFWIQPVENQATLEELAEQVQEEYTTGPSADKKVSKISEGMAVVAKFSEDEAWYRAVVESEGKTASVRFIDYGNSDSVSIDSLRLPSATLMEVPAQALYCSLADVKPLQPGNWNVDAKDIMESMLKEAVSCTFKDTIPNGFSVDIVSDGISVAEELVRAAVVKKESTRKPESPPKDIPVSPVRSEATASQGSVKQRLNFAKIVTLDNGSVEPAYISQVNSLSNFYIQLAKLASELEALMERLEKACGQKSRPSMIVPGMACAAKFSGDEMWYRATVTHVNTDNADVMFIDYGNSEVVAFDRICEISQDCLSLPPQAILCCLKNCSEVADNSAISKFTDLTMDKEVQVQVISSGSPIVVDISVDSTKSLSQLLSSNSSAAMGIPAQSIPTDPNTKVFASYVHSPSMLYVQLASQETNLNDLSAKLQTAYSASVCDISEQELKSGCICCTKYIEDSLWYRAEVQDVCADKCHVLFIDYGNAEEVDSSSLKVLTPEFTSQPAMAFRCALDGLVSVEDKWSEEAIAHLESLVMDQELRCKFVSNTTVCLRNEDGDVAEDLVVQGHAKLVKAEEMKFLLQTKPEGKVLTFVSHVEDVFYLQLGTDEDKLAELSENLQTICEHLSSPQPEQVKEGLHCCAKFSEDQAWYRATVSKVSGEEVGVRFLDFGNCDMVTCDQLKLLNAELLTPALLAYPAVMKGIGRMTDNQQTLFSRLTEDQELTTNFQEMTDDGLFQVTLITNEGKDIGQDFLKAEAAVALDLDETPQGDGSSITLDKTGLADSVLEDEDISTSCVESGQVENKSIVDCVEYIVQEQGKSVADFTVNFCDLGEVKVCDIELLDLRDESPDCDKLPDTFKVVHGNCIENTSEQEYKATEIPITGCWLHEACDTEGKLETFVGTDIDSGSAMTKDNILPEPDSNHNVLNSLYLESVKTNSDVCSQEENAKDLIAGAAESFSRELIFTYEPDSVDTMIEVEKCDELVMETPVEVETSDEQVERMKDIKSDEPVDMVVEVDEQVETMIEVETYHEVVETIVEVETSSEPVVTMIGVETDEPIDTIVEEDTSDEPVETIEVVTSDEPVEMIEVVTSDEPVETIEVETSDEQVETTIKVETSGEPAETIEVEISDEPVETIGVETSDEPVETIEVETSGEPADTMIGKETSSEPVETIKVETYHEPVETIEVETSDEPVDTIEVETYKPVETIEFEISDEPVKMIVVETSDEPVETIEMVTSDELVETIEVETYHEPVETIEVVRSDEPVETIEVETSDEPVQTIEVETSGEQADTMIEKETSSEPVVTIKVVTSDEPVQTIEVGTSDEPVQTIDVVTFDEPVQTIEFEISDKPVETIEVETYNEPVGMIEEAEQFDIPAETTMYEVEISDEPDMAVIEKATSDDPVETTEEVETFDEPIKTMREVETSDESVDMIEVEISDEPVETIGVETYHEPVETLDVVTFDEPVEMIEVVTFDEPVEKIEVVTSGEPVETIEVETYHEPVETIEVETYHELVDTIEVEISDEAVETIEVETSDEPVDTIEVETYHEPGEMIKVETFDEAVETIEVETSDEPVETIEVVTYHEPVETIEVETFDEPVDTIEVEISDEAVETIEVETSDEPVETIEVETYHEPVETIKVETFDEAVETIEVETSDEPLDMIEVETFDEAVETIEVETSDEPVETIEVETYHEPVETIEVETSDEPVETIEVETSDEPVETIEVETSDEPVETIEVETYHEPVETIEVVTYHEPVETIEVVTSDEPVETIEVVTYHEPLETIEVVTYHEPVDTMIEKETSGEPVETIVEVAQFDAPVQILTELSISTDHSRSLVDHPKSKGDYPEALLNTRHEQKTGISDSILGLKNTASSKSVTDRPSHVDVLSHCEDNSVLRDDEVDGTETTNECGDASSTETTDDLGKLTHLALEEGDRVQVTSSHINSPSSFYVHLDRNKDALSSLIDEMFKFYSEYKGIDLNIEFPKVGQLCAVKYTEDESWYRAQVLEVLGSDKFKVEFLDHGNVEECSGDAIRKLLTRFINLPVQTMHCTLGGVRSVDGPWSDEALELFSELLHEKSLLADILCVSTDDACIVQLFDMGILLSQKFIDEGFGVEASTPTYVSKKTKRVFSDSSPMKVLDLDADAQPDLNEEKYPSLELAPSTEYICCVSHAASPGKLWLQLSEKQDDLQTFMDGIQEKYSHEKALTIEEVKRGLPCVCLYGEDGLWYRAVVIDKQDTIVEVLFVDYGNSETVTPAELRGIKSEDILFPRQAFCCCMKGIVPESESEGWEKITCSRLEELTFEKDLKVKICEILPNCCYRVEMSDGEVCLADTLVQGGYAKFSSDRKQETPCEEAVKKEQKAGTGEPSDDSKDDEDFHSIKSDTVEKLDLGPFKPLTVNTDENYTAVILNIISPGCFYVVLEEQSKADRADLVTNIKEYVLDHADEVLLSDEILKGTACLAQLEEDKWYGRAVITGTTDQNVEVYMVDFGVSQCVDSAFLKPLPSDMLHLPAQAIMCSLADIQPIETTEWSEDSTKGFQALSSEYSLVSLYVDPLTKRDSPPYSVTVSVIGAKQGEMFNMQLVELGFADFVPGSTLESEALMDETETSFNELSLLRENSFGSDDETTDIDTSKMTMEESVLETTGASDSFSFISGKQLDKIRAGKDETDDEFYDAEEKGDENALGSTGESKDLKEADDTASKEDSESEKEGEEPLDKKGGIKKEGTVDLGDDENGKAVDEKDEDGVDKTNEEVGESDKKEEEGEKVLDEDMKEENTNMDDNQKETVGEPAGELVTQELQNLSLTENTDGQGSKDHSDDGDEGDEEETSELESTTGTVTAGELPEDEPQEETAVDAKTKESVEEDSVEKLSSDPANKSQQDDVSEPVEENSADEKANTGTSKLLDSGEEKIEQLDTSDVTREQDTCGDSEGNSSLSEHGKEIKETEKS